MADVDQDWILLGDHDDSRREWLRDLLINEFDVAVECFDLFDDLLKYYDSPGRKGKLRQLILADGLYESYFRREKKAKSKVRALFQLVNEPRPSKDGRLIHEAKGDLSATRVCIYSSHAPPEFDSERVKLIEIPSKRESSAARFSVIASFHRIRLKWSPPRPEVSLLPVGDSKLQHHVRQLDPNKQIDGGKRTLGELARWFFSTPIIEVHRMSQGLSGSSVFKITPSGQRVSLVLKLRPKGDADKLVEEISGHLKAELFLKNVLQQSTPVLVPHLLFDVLYPIRTEASLEDWPVYSGSWVALCITYLGGTDLGRFVDMETVLIGSDDEFHSIIALGSGPPPSHEPREWLFNDMLEWLTRRWYLKSELTERRPRQLWAVSQSSTAAGRDSPLYALGANRQTRIVHFLWSSEALGPRLIPEWQEHSCKVQNFVLESDHTKLPRRLDRILPVLLSPVHGDLNANNQFFWIDERFRPFLIDFPAYQERGHAMQDLARIEVELKFALLDRQHGPDSPAAFDQTHSQIALWCELEDVVLSAAVPAPNHDWAAAGVRKNVAFTLRLIYRLRLQAEKIQKSRQIPVDSVPFFEEYLPALLYHTLRAISYDSLSDFKRYFATYSAAKILERLS